MKTTSTIELPASVLVKKQVKTYGPKTYTEHGRRYRITATVRYDDQCGNGHNSFAITADILEGGRDYMGGCCHEQVAKHFPELAPYIKWHLCNSDGPTHHPTGAIQPNGEATCDMADILEPITCNSELEWTSSEHTGDLTDAPMLGILQHGDGDPVIVERWAFMDYQVRSVLEDLRDKGEAVFIS